MLVHLCHVAGYEFRRVNLYPEPNPSEPGPAPWSVIEMAEASIFEGPEPSVFPVGALVEAGTRVDHPPINPEPSGDVDRLTSGHLVVVVARALRASAEWRAAANKSPVDISRILFLGGVRLQHPHEIVESGPVYATIRAAERQGFSAVVIPRSALGSIPEHVTLAVHLVDTLQDVKDAIAGHVHADPDRWSPGFRQIERAWADGGLAFEGLDRIAVALLATVRDRRPMSNGLHGRSMANGLPLIVRDGGWLRGHNERDGLRRLFLAICGLLGRTTMEMRDRMRCTYSLSRFQDVASDDSYWWRPLRLPHWSTSARSLRGSRRRPGELALADCGVMVLDQADQFSDAARNAIREASQGWVASDDGEVNWHSRIVFVQIGTSGPFGPGEGVMLEPEHLHEDHADLFEALSLIGRARRISAGIASGKERPDWPTTVAALSLKRLHAAQRRPELSDDQYIAAAREILGLLTPEGAVDGGATPP